MTDKAIGPTFYAELKAAGLVGLPFSWGADGSLHFSEVMNDKRKPVPIMTPEQIAAVQAVYAAHDATKQDYTAAAQAALEKSDVTIIRFAESGVAVPSAWAAYRSALRGIVSGKQAGPLPVQPAFPANT